eukprot:COSAG02_NODE_32568_length_514_cov_0.990361_1_plen_95_part_01
MCIINQLIGCTVVSLNYIARLSLARGSSATSCSRRRVAVRIGPRMAEDLFAMGGGAWARGDCAAALDGAGGSVEVAMELLMGGFTATKQAASLGA